jgi:hypothetical protein
MEHGRAHLTAHMNAARHTLAALARVVMDTLVNLAIAAHECGPRRVAAFHQSEAAVVERGGAKVTAHELGVIAIASDFAAFIVIAVVVTEHLACFILS